MDAAGRLVVPKALREKLQLAPECKLEIEAAGDGIRLRKAAVATALVRRHGILVHHNPALAPLDVDSSSATSAPPTHRVQPARATPSGRSKLTRVD